MDNLLVKGWLMILIRVFVIGVGGVFTNLEWKTFDLRPRIRAIISTIMFLGLAALGLFLCPPLLAQTLLPWTDKPPMTGPGLATPDTVVVRSFASGNLRGVTTGTTDASSANGSIGISIAWPRVTVAGVINVATSAKRLTSDFGQTILSPATGTGFRSGVLELRIANLFQTFAGPLGLHIYVSASSNSWSSSSDTTHAPTAAVTGLSALAYRHIATASGDNRVSFGLEAGLSIRNLSGDIVGDDSLRTALLGTRQRTFGGLEGGMTISVNKVTAAVQLYYYLPRGVKGVGRVQITTGLSIQADLFTFRSTPEDR
ncbi:MAG: hypothetical protein MUP49_04735 [Dehalococcoidia bacterium]|nr:hypothetical protein [Dehalococcoidia bacterium]